MRSHCKSALALAAALSLTSVAPAAVLFSDPGESLSNFTRVDHDADTGAAAINYSTLGIPEAPGQLAGSAATTGLQLKANKSDTTAAITALNLIFGSTPVTFSGVHTVEFYVWMNVPAGTTSSTENFLAGTVRTDNTLAIHNNFRTSRGNGAWFLLTGDNGSGTDYRHYNQGVAATAKAYNDSDPLLAPQLNAAFTNNLGGTNAEAANEWVKVQLVQDPGAGTSSVYMNGVLFTTNVSTNTTGSAWIGYEDTVGSINADNGLSGIFDNITVSEGNTVPEPSFGALALSGLALIGRRRR